MKCSVKCHTPKLMETIENCSGTQCRLSALTFHGRLRLCVGWPFWSLLLTRLSFFLFLFLNSHHLILVSTFWFSILPSFSHLPLKMMAAKFECSNNNFLSSNHQRGWAESLWVNTDSILSISYTRHHFAPFHKCVLFSLKDFLKLYDR